MDMHMIKYSILFFF